LSGGLCFQPNVPALIAEIVLYFLYLLDKRLIAAVFVAGGPQKHFRKDLRKIDSLCIQHINQKEATKPASGNFLQQQARFDALIAHNCGRSRRY
jgi:hypothetical protein